VGKVLIYTFMQQSNLKSMKLICIIFLSLVFSSYSFTQESFTTSVCLDSAKILTGKNPLLAIKYANMSIVSINNTNDYLLADSYRIIAANNLYLGAYEKAEENYLIALEYDVSNKDTVNILKDYSGIYLVNGEISNFEKSKKYQLLALDLARKSKNYKEAIVIYESMGISSFYQKKYLKAVENYEIALLISEQIKDSSNLVSLYFNLGSVYAEIKKEKLALRTFVKGQTLASLQNNKYVEGNFYLNIGAVYTHLKQIPAALNNYKKAIDCYSECNYTKGIAYAHISLALLYLDLNELELTKEHASQAYYYADVIDDKVVLSLYFNLISKIYFNKKDYTNAIVNSKLALDYAITNKDPLREKEALKLLYKTTEKTGDIKESYEYYKSYVNLKDSLENVETIAKIEILELKRTLDLTQKEARIQAQKSQLIVEEKRADKNKFYFFISIITIFVLSIVSLFIFRLSKAKKEKIILEKDVSLDKIKNRLIVVQLEKEKEKKEILEKEIKLKNDRIRELASVINTKNELLLEFSSDSVFKENRVLNKKLNKLIDSEEERQYFNKEIEQIDAQFYQRIKKLYPALTSKDLKLASMLKIGLSSKEMASLLYISSTSVDVARSRLRKKMNLNKGDDIVEKLNTI